MSDRALSRGRAPASAPLSVVHAMPGRVRLRVEGDANALAAWRTLLAGLTGVSITRVHPSSRSLVLTYDPAEVDLPAVLERALRDSGHGEEKSGPALYRAPSSITARALGASFWKWDAAIHESTGGAVDLKLLIPAALMAAGLWEILLGEAVAGATFHTLAWYAYNIYYQLHPAEMQPER